MDLQSIVTSANNPWRKLLNLPQMAADSVTAVTDNAICQRAALAYGRNLFPPDTTTTRIVRVIRIGTNRYSVSDAVRTTGYWAVNMVFDSSFKTVYARYGHP
jgi:hypothetical protein